MATPTPIGETQLQRLLASMQPQLQPAVFVFCSLADCAPIPLSLSPICQFQEQEGTTLIIDRVEADRAHLAYQYPCRQITLTIHSSLAAVGLLATIAQDLAAEGISVNVVSAYYHDHLFVPCDRADEAMLRLQHLAQRAQQTF